MRIQVDQRAGPGRCPFCHDPAPTTDAIACGQCGVQLHAECHALLLRCPTLGCGADARSFPGLRTYLVDDRYEVLARIGEERYGVAVHAVDRRTERDVTLLYLAGNYPAKAEALAKQVIAEQIAFPRAVLLLGWGRDPRGQRLFVVREFVPGGETLARVFARAQPLNAAEAIWLGRVALDSLAPLHAQGLRYDEIPGGDSLLLARTPEGARLRLANRGLHALASLAAEQAGVNTGSSGLGRLASISAEEFLEVGSTGTGADLYALGVLLYRGLAGALPWRFRAPLDLLYQRSNQVPPEPLRSHRPDLDPELEAVVLRAIAPKAKERYPTAADFAAALAGVGAPPPADERLP